MKLYKLKIKLSLLVLIIGMCSCKKYLEESPDKKLTVISTIADMQSLLDQYFSINQRDPCLGESASDNIYMDYDTWQSIDEFERAVYIWQAGNIQRPYALTGSGNIWSNCYDVIFKANTVLDHLETVAFKPEQEMEWNNVTGQAYFLRGKFFMHAAWIWALAFDSATAKEDLGIPLRLNADFNEVSVRSSVEATYSQIISDLKQAALLLPVKPLNAYRPGKGAAYGYLSRVYLSMRDYDNAGLYADSALLINNELMDYNTDVDTAAAYPIKLLNKEVVYASIMELTMGFYLSKIDSNLYNSYQTDDLRKAVFFYSNADGSHSFRGSYDESGYPFAGIATDEMYFNTMEAKARIGRLLEATELLQHVLSKRWKAGKLERFQNMPQEKLIELILKERRKELVFRELRWMDLKRENKHAASITVSRILNGVNYVLEPNDKRYAMAIPEDVISRSGMQQNPR